ncbi:unnamed protein product [Cyprideis torosa]|uniref:Uncharacterized protein n=1 Tax=Cyprideis torosa TaxID=163714 RepID=A0A7R8WFD3_9CRUS|nr:unnamed protein product [Cyprideis torosa]CAG0894004.1 unnamed protein product [Cyprideis torosa]
MAATATDTTSADIVELDPREDEAVALFKDSECPPTSTTRNPKKPLDCRKSDHEPPQLEKTDDKDNSRFLKDEHHEREKEDEDVEEQAHRSPVQSREKPTEESTAALQDKRSSHSPCTVDEDEGEAQSPTASPVRALESKEKEQASGLKDRSRSKGRTEEGDCSRDEPSPSHSLFNAGALCGVVPPLMDDKLDAGHGPRFPYKPPFPSAGFPPVLPPPPPIGLPSLSFQPRAPMVYYGNHMPFPNAPSTGFHPPFFMPMFPPPFGGIRVPFRRPQPMGFLPPGDGGPFEISPESSSEDYQAILREWRRENKVKKTWNGHLGVPLTDSMSATNSDVEAFVAARNLIQIARGNQPETLKQEVNPSENRKRKSPPSKPTSSSTTAHALNRPPRRQYQKRHCPQKRHWTPPQHLVKRTQRGSGSGATEEKHPSRGNARKTIKDERRPDNTAGRAGGAVDKKKKATRRRAPNRSPSSSPGVEASSSDSSKSSSSSSSNSSTSSSSDDESSSSNGASSDSSDSVRHDGTTDHAATPAKRHRRTNCKKTSRCSDNRSRVPSAKAGSSGDAGDGNRSKKPGKSFSDEQRKRKARK